MTLTADIAEAIVKQAIDHGLDLAKVTKEALLLELFRRKAINHAALREALGMSLLETDALLKERRIPLGAATREEQIERNQPLLQALRDVAAMTVSPDEPSWETVKAAIARLRTER